ncbi:MAG: hypothetical protein ACOCTM_03330 [Bacteroidota bacterium]
MKRKVLIREKDLGLGSKEIVFSSKEIEEEDTEIYCNHRGKKLKLEAHDTGSSFRAVEVVESAQN